jgi:hemoglobin-like flavoprotein
MFNTSIEVQSRKLMESLRHTVAMLEQPETLIPVLEGLGRRHLAYGTKPEHYDIVVCAMMRMLADVLDRRFTAETAAVWHDALNFVSSVMQRGAASAVPGAA